MNDGYTAADYVTVTELRKSYVTSDLALKLNAVNAESAGKLG